MLRPREHHVLETPEHVRPDHVALVAAGQRSDDDLRAGRDTEVIGPERDQTLDEWPLAGDACRERRMHLRLAHLDDVTARQSAFLLVALTRHADRAQRLAHGRCRRAVGRCECRRSTVERSLQPLAAVTDLLPFSATGAESES